MSKKIKVLHLLSSNIYSGAENVACTIISMMSDEYEMLYCSPNGKIIESLKEKKIKYVEIEKLNRKNFKKIIDLIQPDIIHAHDFKASFIAGTFGKKIKVISHIHKNDPAMKKRSIKSYLYLFFSKRFYRIVGVSDSILDEYIFSKKIKDKYITLPNYVDRDLVIKKSNEYVVKKDYDLFYFGRLCDEKNPLEFIEIVNRLNDKKIRCVMIGDGPLKNQCIQLINNYNLIKNIDMVGYKSNPFPYIKKSKIGIMPSKYEGFGLTAIEASILGKPVLNSGVGGLTSIFKNYKSLICKSLDEYIKKIHYYNNSMSTNFDMVFLQYTKFGKWKKLINKIYK